MRAPRLAVLLPLMVLPTFLFAACGAENKKASAAPDEGEAGGAAGASAGAAGTAGASAGKGGSGGGTAGKGGSAGTGTGGAGTGGGGTGGGGSAGAAGTSGMAGSAGTSGTAGTAGAAGSAGKAGASGSAGAGGGLPEGTCTDTMQTDKETDVDCGGGACPPCANLLKCGTAKDCQSGVCTSGKCAVPSCMDSIKNQDESDADCGGAKCTACADGKACTSKSDCTSGVCTGNQCAKATCTDGVKNGNETDTDCGGSCPSKCPFGQKCLSAGDCVSATCKDMVCKCPFGMTVVPKVDGGSYCIDATEVTYAEYQAFWAANPQANDQTFCSWNKTYTPSAAWPPQPSEIYKPVAYVDWCDARAYCAWAGKHLCGKVGVTGGNAYADYAKANASEWFNACSAQGVNVYPYGATFTAGQCNANGSGTVPVQITPGMPVTGNPVPSPCLGGAPGLYQMSGNVAEWEDSCDASVGATDQCRVRGGSFTSVEAELKCDAAAAQARNATSANVGFRCCLLALPLCAPRHVRGARGDVWRSRQA